MKKCPFCGSKKIDFRSYIGYKYFTSYAYCTSCKARGPEIDRTPIEKELVELAFQGWNTRK